MATNYEAGHSAEIVASEWLKAQGYKIIELNWKTPRCEIDIVARKKKTLHFVEAKYRRNDSQGSGLDYITPKKLKQMSYAAELYVSINKWKGDYCLSAIELGGQDNNVQTFIDNIDI